MSLHAPGVRSADGDVCHCGHPIDDHTPEVFHPASNPPKVIYACGVFGCPCRDYEADGYGPDPDDPSWRDA